MPGHLLQAGHCKLFQGEPCVFSFSISGWNEHKDEREGLRPQPLEADPILLDRLEKQGNLSRLRGLMDEKEFVKLREALNQPELLRKKLLFMSDEDCYGPTRVTFQLTHS